MTGKKRALKEKNGFSIGAKIPHVKKGGAIKEGPDLRKESRKKAR